MSNKFSIISPGATACMVAISYGPTTIEEVPILINNITTLVKSYGLKPIIYPELFSPTAHKLFDSTYLPLANTDEQKFNYLYSALNNDECDIIWNTIDGSGAIGFLSKLIKSPPPKNTKPLIGFGDTTLVHMVINSVWGMPTIYYAGADPSNPYVQDPENIKNLQKILFAKPDDVISFQLNAISDIQSTSTIMHGTTCGGYKYSFHRIQTTKFAINLEQKILLLEANDEKARWLDGFLTELTLNQGFKNITAVIFGSILSQESDDYGIFQRILQDFAYKITPIPVFKMIGDNPIGHGSKIAAMLLGVNASISFNETSQLYDLTINATNFIDSADICND